MLRGWTRAQAYKDVFTALPNSDYPCLGWFELQQRSASSFLNDE
jgi:hypothetical protein